MRYEQIKPLLSEEVLDEVKMSPSALQKFANSPEADGMLMGIEFELVVPNVAVDDDSGEGEYDYDMDERCYSIDDIIEFFSNGEMSNLGPSSARRLREEMLNQYLDWTGEKISDNIDEDELNDRIRDRLDGEIDFDDMKELALEQWKENNPDENPEDKAAEDEIHQMALALNEKTLDDMMEDTDSREYQYAYDEVRQELEDEMRNDSDYDQEAWLRDLGIDFMSEAEREWGLDWPHWRYYGGEGELDVETVADEFGRAMGLDYVNSSNNYHGARRDGKNWIVEPDSSIDADEGDGGLEFVSPPMPIKDGLEMLQKMYAWAKKEGCYTNKSTGLHMNISVPDMTIDKLDYVKLALFLGDEHVLKQFGREYNSYCKSAMSKIKDRIRPEDVPAVLAQMKQHLNSLASKTIHSGITDKYTSINTKSNYVEFRGPGGDYLDQNPFDLINTVLRLSMSLRIATDPEAYKQEYAKKLYKLVEQEKNPDDSVKLFSKYAIGEMPKEDLVARLKFAKKGRELEKTKKAAVTQLNKDEDVKRKIEGLPEKWRRMLKDMSPFSDQELQSTINTLNAGEYDDELDPDVEVPLAIAVLQSELDWRQAQSEIKSYWVMNKDGSGGKQLVHANNENEAILKGGKNMGMSREQSITRLRAEEKSEDINLDDMSSDEFNRQVNDLPTYTLSKFVNEIKTKERSTLETALRNVKARNMSSEISAMNYEFLQAVIERELKRRETEGEPNEMTAYGNRKVYPRSFQDKIAAMPNPFNTWLLVIPSNTDEVLRKAKLKAVDGDYNGDLTGEQKQLLIKLVDDELTYRATSGEGRMAGDVGGSELRFEPGTPMQIGTPEPDNAEELFNSLPNSWKSWLDGMSASNEATLQSVVDNVANGTGSATQLSIEQRDLVISRIQAEMRSRNSTTAQAGEWPRPWNVWVQNIQTHDTANLRNVRATAADIDSTMNLSSHQRVQLVNKIDDEFRRRLASSIEQGEQARAAQQGDIIAPGLGEVDPLAAQQAELIDRDDPVTSNDPDSQAHEPEPQAVPGQGTQEFQIVNPHTGSVVAVIRQATLDHAVSKARQWEHDLGLSAGDLEVRQIGETNESLNTIRRLAGL